MEGLIYDDVTMDDVFAVPMVGVEFEAEEMEGVEFDDVVMVDVFAVAMDLSLIHI